MPKMKTNKAAAKRFKMTATGKLKHGVAGKRHRLISHKRSTSARTAAPKLLATGCAAHHQEVPALRPEEASS